jgi:hypothetical protein
MSETIDAGISLLTDVTAAKDLKVTDTQESKLPPKVLDAFKKWASELNIPLDDPDTSVDILTGTYSKGKQKYYVFQVSGDNPDQFGGSVVIQDNKVIGYSLGVGD